nr:hypothetical protein CFP56_19504 [Quercus suber]
MRPKSPLSAYFRQRWFVGGLRLSLAMAQFQHLHRVAKPYEAAQGQVFPPYPHRKNEKQKTQHLHRFARHIGSDSRRCCDVLIEVIESLLGARLVMVRRGREVRRRRVGVVGKNGGGADGPAASDADDADGQRSVSGDLDWRAVTLCSRSRRCCDVLIEVIESLLGARLVMVRRGREVRRRRVGVVGKNGGVEVRGSSVESRLVSSSRRTVTSLLPADADAEATDLEASTLPYRNIAVLQH